MAAVAFSAGILLGRAADRVLWAWAALACAAGAVILGRNRLRLAACIAAVCALGAVYSWYAYHPQLPPEGDYVISGVVSSEIRYGDFGQVKTVLQQVKLNGEKVDNAYWSFYLDEEEALPEGLTPGRKVTFYGRLYHPTAADNPDGYDFREYLLQQGITVGVYGRGNLHISDAAWSIAGAAAKIRHTLAEGLTAAMGREAGGYASEMLLGVKSLIPSEDRAAFSRLGIAHVLCISGFHVGVLAKLLGWLLKRMHTSRWLQALLTGAMLCAYCLLTGMHAPVLRATILLLMREYGKVRQRQSSPIHLLSAAWLLILAMNPCQLTGASFQLTFFAVLGLVMVSPTIEHLWDAPKGRMRKTWSTFSATMGAQIGLLVPQLYWFGELPLMSLALNMIVFAAAAAMMTLYWLTLALLPLPSVAGLVGRFSALLTGWLAQGVRFLGELDGVTLWTPQANLLTALGWLVMMLGVSWQNALAKRSRRLLTLGGAALLVLSLMPLPHAGTTYLQFSVGDADAALIHDENMTVAIDMGEDGYDTSRYLHHRRLGLDALVLTHLHYDHAGGVEALLHDRIPVKTCYIPEGALEAEIMPDMAGLLHQLAATGTKIVTVSRGDVINLPSGSLTVLWPEKGRVRPGKDPNISSMALYAQLHGTTMLLTGDLAGEYAHYAAAPADVLKVAHHGSADSTTDAFLDAVAPTAAVISTSMGSRMERLARRTDAAVYATDVHGAITIDMDETGYTITTMK